METLGKLMAQVAGRQASLERRIDMAVPLAEIERKSSSASSTWRAP